MVDISGTIWYDLSMKNNRPTKAIADREESEPCQAGTIGCCIDHAESAPGTDCEAW